MAHAKLGVISITTAGSAGTEIASPILYGLSKFDSLLFYASLQGVTGGTLDVYLQNKLAVDAWADWCHFTQLAAGGGAVVYVAQTAPGATIITTGIGTDATPGGTLAANTCVACHPGDIVRAVFVSGAGTTAGKAQTIRALGVCNK